MTVSLAEGAAFAAVAGFIGASGSAFSRAGWGLVGACMMFVVSQNLELQVGLLAGTTTTCAALHMSRAVSEVVLGSQQQACIG
jgi:hypothetical protein